MMSLFKNIKSYFPKNEREVINYTKKSYLSDSPCFISLKSIKNKKINKLIFNYSIRKNYMGELRNIVTSLHQSTSRKYLDRMIDNKVECMKTAKEYEQKCGMVIEDLVTVDINIFLADGSQLQKTC